MKNLLRPLTFDEFFGQEKIKYMLKVAVDSAKKRKCSLDHIILYGPPGVGKTSMASIIAAEMNQKIRFAQGPLLEKKSDLISLFCSINDNEIIFIDEIHGINKNIEEILYSAIEDGAMDIIVGPDGESKIIRLKLPIFTLIGATTKIGGISKPLRDRFGIQVSIDNYTLEDMEKIVEHSSEKLSLKINPDGIKLIASYSRQTPRLANNLIKRIRDFAAIESLNEISETKIIEIFNKIGIYKFGLSDSHIKYLKCLNTYFESQWTSIDAIIGYLMEEKSVIEQEIESPLLGLNLIEKTSRGRKITNIGIDYLKSL